MPPPPDLDPSVELDTSRSLGLSLPEVAPWADALIDTSSSSASDWVALNDSALRRRPLSPPLWSMLAVGVGASIIRSLSSHDILFSATVKLPCESGEGPAGRGISVEMDVEEIPDDDEVITADEGGESTEDRVVTVDVDDDVKEFR